VQKWQSREQVEDLSHRPHRLSTTLSTGEEAVVVELRKTLMLPLDDLLVVTREFIDKLASRSGIDRCLRRHGAVNLRQLQSSVGNCRAVSSDRATGSAGSVGSLASWALSGFQRADRFARLQLLATAVARRMAVRAQEQARAGPQRDVGLGRHVQAMPARRQPPVVLLQQQGAKLQPGRLPGRRHGAEMRFGGMASN
jgi:hypothetical protein